MRYKLEGSVMPKSGNAAEQRREYLYADRRNVLDE